MMSGIGDEIASYFAAYGWRCERREPALFQTGFAGSSGGYDIWVRHSDAWVYFTISPYLPKPKDRAHGPEVLGTLLRANHELNLAKFALTNDGDVLLTVELPVEGFCYAHFSDALTAIAHYADECRVRFLAALARDGAEVA